MNKSTSHKRLILPDLLKGIAILFMIQVHLMELLAKQQIFDSVWGEISLFLGGAPAAPLFMIIMGYFVAWKNQDRLDLIGRGIKLFILGILLNIGLNLHLIYKVLFEQWSYNLYEYIFGVDILHFAGLSLIFIGLILKWIKSNQWYIFSFILLVFILQSIIPENNNNTFIYINSFIIGGTSWSYFPLIPWLAYPLTGIMFYQLESQLPTVSNIKPKTTALLLAFILFMILTWNFSTNISYNLPIYYHHGFDYFIWTLMFLGMSILLISIKNKTHYKAKWAKYLIFTGRNITNIYVFQWLIIGNLATSYYKQFDGLQIIISFVIITILSSVMTYFYQKIKEHN